MIDRSVPLLHDLLMDFRTARPNFFLSEENYYQLTGPGFYKINEVPADRHSHLPRMFNTQDSFVVFASGVPPYVVQQGGTGQAAAFDWIRLESNRKAGEPPLNAYHYVIGHSGTQGFPVYGPFLNGAIIPHHPTGDFPLDAYVRDANAGSENNL